MKKLNKVVKSGKQASVEIKAGYKLVRNETKTKRVNLVLTQSNYNKLHQFIDKQKKSNPKASINEYFNKHIETIEETKSNNTLQDKEKKARVAEIEKQIKENEQEIERLKKEVAIKESQNKADAESEELTEEQQKVFDRIAEHLGNKLLSNKTFTNEEIKTMFLYCIYNTKIINEKIASIVSALENFAYKHKPIIEENFKTLAGKIKELESKI